MRNSEAFPSVLITGCSSGIGRATAIHLAARGYCVYATARRPETIEALAEHGCRLLRLDVCDEASRQEAVCRVEAEQGAVGVLVNNAGYGLTGAIEALPLDAVRSQFETNLSGPLRLAQLALPGMRRRRSGRIVNVSSVGGRIPPRGSIPSTGGDSTERLIGPAGNAAFPSYSRRTPTLGGCAIRQTAHFELPFAVAAQSATLVLEAGERAESRLTGRREKRPRCAAPEFRATQSSRPAPRAAASRQGSARPRAAPATSRRAGCRGRRALRG